MTTEALDIIFGFFRHTTHEVRITRISGTCKDKVLPYQDTHFVCCIIKMIILINTTTPYTNQIMIGFLRILNQLIITIFSNIRQQSIIRNQVRTLGKHRLTIHYEIECLAVLIIFQYNLNGTQAYPFLFRSNDFSIDL